MPKTNAIARVLKGNRLECVVTSSTGATLTLTGKTGDSEPTIEGAPQFTSNRALVNNAWAFAKFRYHSVNLPTEDEQEVAADHARTHEKLAESIAAMADDLGNTTVRAWCSSCFQLADHRNVRNPPGPLPGYLCAACGSPTLTCPAPGCEHMAVRTGGLVRVPRYCAEHRHDTPGFEKASVRLESITDYRTAFEFAAPNLARATKITGVSLAALATGGLAAYAAAPAIGGAIGVQLGGFSGAAASSYGLAVLGGGSLAAGGFGMAGGTAVIATLGGLLGGGLGAAVTNAYVREDSSFSIEQVREGPGVPVLACNGWLSEKATGWEEWRSLITKRYPDSPVFVVRWGAKELKDLGVIGLAAAEAFSAQTLKAAALSATRAGAVKLGPLGPLLFAATVAKNPWHVAKVRADKTGVILADLISRTTAESYVLVGHSLGSRVMAVATQTLGTKAEGPRVEAAHLLGAAIGAKSDWTTLTRRTGTVVYNYHSSHDSVLKYLYSAAQLGQKAAGVSGFAAPPPGLHNIDVSTAVNGHNEYRANVTLR